MLPLPVAQGEQVGQVQPELMVAPVEREVLVVLPPTVLLLPEILLDTFLEPECLLATHTPQER